VLDQGRVAEGHVFNLGHGVPPQTDPAVLARVADLVHETSARAAR
jgi:uroporphyrinogen decarboxylase